MALNPSHAHALSAGSPFASNLFSHVIESTPKQNVILSPYSIGMALALTSQIAFGTTLKQISDNLHMGDTHEEIAHKFSENHKNLKRGIGSAVLSIANKIFVTDQYKLQKTFSDAAHKHFDSDSASINFKNKEAACKDVNDFVKSKTAGKISEIIQPSDLDEFTRLAIINAIYFKAQWQKSFADSYEMNFFLDETNSVRKQLMFLRHKSPYAEISDLQAKVLELKYKNSDLSMVVILPNSKSGLSQLESTLKTYDLSNIKNHLRIEQVEIYFPKFKFETHIELKPILENMGMTEMFNGAHANINPFQTERMVNVDKVIHKAFIEVNEQGTEAGAANAMIFAERGGFYYESEPKSFRADHPFVFYIMNINTNNVIFSGHLLQ